MATILQFPTKVVPVEPSCTRHQVVDGFFGVRLSTVFAAIQYYAHVVDDQNKAFDLLLELAEKDELEEYVGLNLDLLPLIGVFEESTIRSAACVDLNNINREID